VLPSAHTSDPYPALQCTLINSRGFHFDQETDRRCSNIARLTILLKADYLRQECDVWNICRLEKEARTALSRVGILERLFGLSTISLVGQSSPGIYPLGSGNGNGFLLFGLLKSSRRVSEVSFDALV